MKLFHSKMRKYGYYYYYHRCQCTVLVCVLALWNGTFAHTTVASTVITTTTTITEVAPASGGPNVCRSRYRNYCCPGWKTKPGTNLCIIPVCWRHCGDGSCVKPNICLCEDGAIGTSCPRKMLTLNQNHSDDVLDENRNSCLFFCSNGGTCVNDKKCICKPGFAGNLCEHPACEGGCLNGGRCIGPDRCACVYGYTGKKCEIDYRIGPCFRKVVNNTCGSQLEDVMCTKQLCCATIGRAWGHPCEQCPLHLDCGIGFLKNLHSGQCIDQRHTCTTRTAVL